MSWNLSKYMKDLLNVYKGEDILEKAVKKNIKKNIKKNLDEYYSSINLDETFDKLDTVFDKFDEIFPQKNIVETKSKIEEEFIKEYNNYFSKDKSNNLDNTKSVLNFMIVLPNKAIMLV